MVIRKDTAHTTFPMGTNTLENTRMTKGMDTAITLMPMVKSMSVSGNTANSMAKVL